MATVLIAEDDEDNREILTEVLSAEGHEVLCATNGVDTLDIATEKKPAVILMDLNMPADASSADAREGVGLATVRALRRAEVTRNIAIIALSGADIVALEPQLLENGCDAVAGKPYDFAKVLALINRFAHGR